jgi:hypothetical protein
MLGVSQKYLERCAEAQMRGWTGARETVTRWNALSRTLNSRMDGSSRRLEQAETVAPSEGCLAFYIAFRMPDTGISLAVVVAR